MNYRYICLGALLALGPLCYGDLNEKLLKSEFKKLIAQQEKLEEHIEKIKGLLGVSTPLEQISFQKAPEDADQKIKELTTKALELAKEQKLDEAKETLQEAWEQDPEGALTQWNLGLAYAKINKPQLAKKYLKRAMELKKDFPEKDKVLAYLTGEKEEPVKKEEKLLKEEKTELANKQKEIDSLMRASHLSQSEKMRSVITLLKEMDTKSAEDKELVKEYALYIADVFSAFELYTDAKEVMERYEEAMGGTVLPDGFFGKKLELEKKLAEQEAFFEKETAKTLSPDVQFQIQESVEELKVFASQMEELVPKASPEDHDFQTVCKRLKEFRWGNKPNRHVLVLNRYQEILFSSLDGTLPIERYRDTQGVPFLKEITRIPPQMVPFKGVKTMPLELNVGGKVVPYIVLYTYVPKHEAFIVVRLNQEQLPL